MYHACSILSIIESPFAYVKILTGGSSSRDLCAHSR